MEHKLNKNRVGANKHCVYGDCNTDSRPGRPGFKPNLRFFPFPKPCLFFRKSDVNDINSKTFRAQHISKCSVCKNCDMWIKKCLRNDLKFSSIANITKDTYICAEHFPETTSMTITANLPLPLPSSKIKEMEIKGIRKRQALEEKYVQIDNPNKKLKLMECDDAIEETDDNVYNSKIKLEDITEINLEDLHHEVDIKDEYISEPECYEEVVDDDKHKSYICTICDKNFSQKGHLTVHLKIHNSEKEFSCKICDYKCVQNANLRRHVRSHTGEKPFECKICNKKYGQNKTLQQHLLTHTNKKVYKCSLCGYTCFQIESMGFHLKTHKHDDPKCSCEMCNYKNWCEMKSLKDTDLSDLMEAHRSDEAFECDKSIPKIDLNRNIKKESLELELKTEDEKPFTCHICDYKYSQEDLLIIHLGTHAGQKPFACLTCGYRYSRKEHLEVHFRTHAGKAPFSCEICDFKFSRKELLKNHSKIHNEKPFACEICGYRYWRKEHLTVHLRTH